MSLVTNYSRDEFVDEFDLDFGSGVRGQLVSTNSGFKGLIITHLVGPDVCAIVLPLELPHKTPLWGVERQDGPLTITGPPIICTNCPENHKGTIVEGTWQPIQ